MDGRLNAMWWTAVILVVSGIAMSFSSAAFGQARASAWLSGQYEGVGDGETYQLIMETNTLVFVVFGSILFGFGILLALANMGIHIFVARPKQNAELDESFTEVEVH